MADIENPQPNEWDRLPGEPTKLYGYFDIYRQMDPAQRSIVRAYRQSSPERANAKASSARDWKRVSERWDWVRRAAAWDDHVRQEEEAARRKAFLERYNRLAKRRADLRFDALEMADPVKQRVKDMLAVPHVEVRTEPGPDGEVTIIKPHKWTAGDIGRLASAYVELIQFATEDVPDEFAEEAEQERRGGGEEVPIDLANTLELIRMANDILAAAKSNTGAPAASADETPGSADAGADRVGQAAPPAGQP